MTTIRTNLPVDQGQRLWAALVQARVGTTPLTCAHTEDAVFGFYLPMARTMARQSRSSAPVDRAATVDRAAAAADADRAAELGLAEAVLAWQQPDSAGFERFARAAITARLQRLDTRERSLRHAGDLGIPAAPAANHRRSSGGRYDRSQQ